MAVVWIPSLLRDLTGGQETVTVAGVTVRQVIDALERSYPGIRDRLCDANGLRAGIAVAVDTQVSRRGLSEPVGEQSEVHFLPAVSGGAPPKAGDLDRSFPSERPDRCQRLTSTRGKAVLSF